MHRALFLLLLLTTLIVALIPGVDLVTTSKSSTDFRPQSFLFFWSDNGTDVAPVDAEFFRLIGETEEPAYGTNVIITHVAILGMTETEEMIDGMVVALTEEMYIYLSRRKGTQPVPATMAFPAQEALC
jgi:hypothetical protein